MTHLIRKFRSTQDNQILSRFATKLKSDIAEISVDIDLKSKSILVDAGNASESDIKTLKSLNFKERTKGGITTVTQITKIAKRFGWQKDYVSQGSHYYSINLRIEGGPIRFRFRFSDHSLGQDWTGRQQTANCNQDFDDWQEQILTTQQLENMFRFPELAGELYYDDSVDRIKQDYNNPIELKESHV